jgi:xylulokinase
MQVTGGAPGLSGKDPVSHILFIRDAHPDVYARTATFLEPCDYLNLKLTGRASASFDSIAAHWVTDNRTIDRVDYDDRLLEITGLDRARLPDLVPPGTIMGSLTAAAASDLGVPAGLPVAVGSGDVHSAVFGSGAVADFAAHLYIGTSAGRALPDRRRARDGGRLPDIPARQPGTGRELRRHGRHGRHGGAG